jgi:murein DD-endopeptidase MepM/ murein hydrolase activator NlpD
MKGNTRRAIGFCAAALVAAALLVPANATPAVADSMNAAAALRWNGHVDTDLKFSEFFGGDHTLVARIMLQYPRAYRGPVFGVRETCSGWGCSTNDGPTFEIGQGSFHEDKTCANSYCVDAEKLVVEVSGVKRTYILPDEAKAGTWQHLAVVRDLQSISWGGKTVQYRVYMNGEKLCANPTIYSDCDLTLSNPDAPEGTLRLGRTTRTSTGSSTTDQFYGFIDDAAVFTKAMTASEIKNLAVNVPRLTGSESGLYAGYTFDDYAKNGNPLPAKLARPITVQSPAYRVPFMSQTRINANDAKFLPLPKNISPMRLPFPKEQPWKIIQGFASGSSHSGASAFSLDGVYAGPYLTTNNMPVHAAGAGTVEGSSVAGPCAVPYGEPDECEVLRVTHNTSEVFSYRHLDAGSIKDAFGGSFPTAGTPVSTGQQVARVGWHTNGSHLHFGLRNGTATGTLTIPSAYSNYEVLISGSPGNNEVWSSVSIGIPQDGQIVRHH